MNPSRPGQPSPQLVFHHADGRWRCGDYVIEAVDAAVPKHRRRYRVRRGEVAIAVTVTVRMARLRAAEDARQR